MHDILIICLSIFYCFLAELTRQLLHNLLSRLGAKHPQALVYPLFVALKSPREDRKAAAEILMSSLRHSSPKLVDQALLVSQELIRVAILLQEIWHEALEVRTPPPVTTSYTSLFIAIFVSRLLVNFMAIIILINVILVM